MKQVWNKVTSYSREFSFAVRNSVDWSTRIRLLKNTALFHLNNSISSTTRSNSQFIARLYIDAQRDARLTLRQFAGDIFVLYEVLMGQSYNIPDTMLAPDQVQVILDCGANIGITSLFFAARYPNARIYSIEPNQENFELLKRNTAAEPRILPIYGAIVGYSRKSVRLTTREAAWGNFVTGGDEGSEVPAFTVEQICEGNSLSRVDLLKVDIEGAEKEMFENGSFMRRVGFVIIELHKNYGLEQFSANIAPWSFVAVTPTDDRRLKMIVAQRKLG